MEVIVMFDKIKSILKEISDCPNVYISQSQEYVLEPIVGSDIKDYFRYLKFAIIKKYDHVERVVYKASCKENNPEEYLKEILNDLTTIKNNYLKAGEL